MVDHPPLLLLLLLIPVAAAAVAPADARCSAAAGRVYAQGYRRLPLGRRRRRGRMLLLLPRFAAIGAAAECWVALPPTRPAATAAA